MMYYHTHKKGFSLIEVLVAISVLLVMIVGPMTIAARSVQYAREARQQTTAFFLAQEGLEIFTASRNDWIIMAAINKNPNQRWRWTKGGFPSACIGSGNTCAMDIENLQSLASGASSCAGGNSARCRLYVNGADYYVHTNSGESTEYARYLNATPIGGDIYRITSRVIWETRGGVKDVVLESYLYDIHEI